MRKRIRSDRPLYPAGLVQWRRSQTIVSPACTNTTSAPDVLEVPARRSRNPRLVAIVPVLDEETTVGEVVRGLVARGIACVVVADNGSADRTAERARAAGAVVALETARGYGSACAAGAAAAARFDPEFLLFVDGDGSDVLDDVPALLAPIFDGRFDLVVGAREPLLPFAPHVRAGNWIAAVLLRRLFRCPASDLGPMRAIRWSTFLALGMRDRRCGWTVEMQARASLIGARVGEVPVRYRPRRAGSKISGTVRGSLVASYDILRTIAVLAIERVGTR